MVAALAHVAPADWPQFQGPGRDGVSTETIKLADSWPAGGPRVVWKMEGKLGTGFGGPVVAGGQIYLFDRVNDQQDVLRSIDLGSGKQEWTFAYYAPPQAKDDPEAGRYKGGYNGSRNLPTVDGGRVYILGPFGDLHCVNPETHQAVWARNIIRDYGANLGNWGICQSPAVYGKMVIVAPLSKKAGIVAFDKGTGKEVWKSEPLGGIAWTSPFISTVDGVDQVVMLLNRNEPRLTGLDAATGRKLWLYEGWKCPNPVASHTDCGRGRFFITGGYGCGCVMVQAARQSGRWQVRELFRNKNCGAQACKPVCYKGHLYANSTDFGNGLMCLGLAGNVKWKTANGNEEENGSVLIADGKIFSLLSETGVLRLVRASTDGHQELASASVCGGGNTWAPMAVSDGKLLIRRGRTLVCLDVGAVSGAAGK
jgi:outer membrane protein assembly factor BamB